VDGVHFINFLLLDMVDINPGLSSGPSYTHLKEGPAGAPHDVCFRSFENQCVCKLYETCVGSTGATA